MADIGSVNSITPTPGATVSIAVGSDAKNAVAKWTAGESETVNLTGTQRAGQMLTLIITNDAVIRTITFGTGFASSGVAVGTALKASVLTFVSDGTTYYETGRSLAVV